MKLKIALAVAVLLFAGVVLAEGRWAEIRPEPPGPGAVTPVGRESVTDPTGDTFGSGAVQHDIVEFRGERIGTDLIITIVFDGTISPADAGNADDLGGAVDIDSDQNPGTGSSGVTGGNCVVPNRGLGVLGVDWIVDLFSYDSKSGQMEVFDGNITRGGGGGGFVDADFTSNSVTITVPFSFVGTADGIVDMATVVGTDPEPTDCAPDGSALTVPVEVQSFSVD